MHFPNCGKEISRLAILVILLCGIHERNVLAVQDTAVQSNSVFGSQYGRFDSILRDQGEGSGSNQFGSSDDEDYDTDYSNRVDSGGYLPDNQGNNGHEDTSHYVWQKPAAGTNDPVLPLYPDVVPDDQKNRIGTSWKEFNRLQQPPDNGKGGGVPLANPAHNNILSQLDDYDVNANNDEYDYYTQYDNYNEISNDPLNIVGSEGQQPSIKHPSNPNSVNDHRDSSDGFGRVITGTGAGDQGPFGQERGSLANEYRPQQPNNNDNLPHDPAYDDNYDYEEGSDDFDSTDWFITVEGSSFNSLDPDSEVNVFPTPSTPVPTLATAVTTVTAWPAFPTLPKIVDVQPPLDPNSFGENSFVLPDKHTFEEVNPAGIPIDYNNYIDDTYDANNPDTYDDIEMYGGLSHVDQESSGNDNILDPDAEDRTDYKAIDNEDAIGHAMLTTTSSMVQTTVPLTTRTPSTSTSTLTFTTFTPASQPTSSKSSVSLTTLTTREGSANTTTSGIASPTKPPSKTDEKFVPKRKNPYVDPFIKPGILAALIGGAIVGLLAAILLVMFLVYRIRKKDEGSYALDEPKGPPYPYQYQKAPPREFYA